MPIYEFHCNSCGKDFEELVFGNEEHPACTECGSENTEKLISRPCRTRSGFDIGSMPAESSHASGGCAGCSGGSCATCGH